ncbi:hypothetical protein DPMN_101401 [Dreissena polymorpha]|uniref:Uncharacterized protein n=1 Tax=Dreissena polymorpha TaxID=45954 RepID=A0A9D4LHG8_DREPO|nr:hypothetical protein DPMN_101401 [Dreissena polymorpha]
MNVKAARNKEYYAKLTLMYMGVEMKQNSFSDPEVESFKVHSLSLENENCTSNSKGFFPDHPAAEPSQTSQPENSNSKSVNDICDSTTLDH